MPGSNSWTLERATAHLLESARVKEKTAAECTGMILAGACLMAETFKMHGKMLLCGNGGSAADCQHMAAELVSRLTADFERPGLPAIALTCDTSFLTAFSNDCGYDGVFARQVSALGRPGDLLLGISTGGNSKNVILAVETAKEMKMNTFALTGSGGKLQDLADVCIRVPSNSTQHIQETHITIVHILCDIVERRLFAKDGLEEQRMEAMA